MPGVKIASAVFRALLGGVAARSGIRCNRVHRSVGKEFSLLIGPIADAVFIKLAAAFEPVESEVFHQGVFLIVRQRVGEGVTRCWCGLEALVAPAAVQIEITHRLSCR